MSKIDEMHKQLEELTSQLEKIQEECTHPIVNLDVKHTGDSGNYDPINDCYWAEYRCVLCEKFWKTTYNKK
jgi:hypothetical protein